jgi:hypothetical protein
VEKVGFTRDDSGDEFLFPLDRGRHGQTQGSLRPLMLEWRFAQRLQEFCHGVEEFVGAKAVEKLKARTESARATAMPFRKRERLMEYLVLGLRNSRACRELPAGTPC